MKQVDTVRIEFPAQFRYLSTLSSIIESLLLDAWQLDCTKETLYEVQLAVHEICNNIIQHAYGHEEGTIWGDFQLTPQDRRLSVILHDRGQAFDLSTVNEPDLEQAQEGGYGLFLVRQLMDEMHYEPENGNNRWFLSKTV